MPVGLALSQLAALSLLFASGRGQAQSEGVAESLFREARERMKHGDPEQACPKFAESYRLDPSIGTLLNLGLCEQRLGRVATAWTKLRQFIDAAPADDARRPLAEQKIAELEPVLPKLRLVAATDLGAARVLLDGIELQGPSLGVTLPVDPGEHVIRVALASGESADIRVKLALSERLDVPVARPERAVPGLAPRAANRGRAPKVRRNTERTLAYLTLGTGAAGLLTSGAFVLLAWQEKQVVHAHCPEHTCVDGAGLAAARAGARHETAATVAFTAGALALAAGGVLWWHSGKSGVTVTAGVGSASLSLVGDLP